MKATPSPKQLALWATVCVFLLAASRAVAGPPFLTDDPEPVEYQHSELYIASQITKTADGTQGTIPHIEYNYGVAPNFMAHIVVPYAFSDPKNGSSEAASAISSSESNIVFFKRPQTFPWQESFL